MNEAVLKLWTAALRSGDYLQNTSALRTLPNGKEASGYCCLGVLCDLAEQAGVVESKPDEYSLFVKYGNSDEDAVLPQEVMEWAGIDENAYGVDVKVEIENLLRTPSEEGYECSTDGRIALTTLNDIENYTFSEIATVIEREFNLRSNNESE